jgi:WhiB family redox-sensing transcriptional regulator
MINSAISFPNFPEAKCSEGDPDYFFPTSKEEQAERLENLQSICSSCIHQSDCAEFALNENIQHGFWGGLTSEERSHIVKVRGKHFDLRHKKLHEIIVKRSHGWTDHSIAKSMGIDIKSLERTVDRGRKKGLVQ